MIVLKCSHETRIASGVPPTGISRPDGLLRARRLFRRSLRLHPQIQDQACGECGRDGSVCQVHRCPDNGAGNAGPRRKEVISGLCLPGWDVRLLAHGDSLHCAVDGVPQSVSS